MYDLNDADATEKDCSVEGLWSVILVADGMLGNDNFWSTTVTKCLQSAKLV